MATTSPPAALLPRLYEIARAAGAAILSHYQTPTAVELKADGSPVTAADRAAEAVILPALAALTPAVPVVSEEADPPAAAAAIDPDQPFWLVDPLDGTKEFLNRNGEFTVNIALVQARTPVLGVVYAPAIDRLFAGALPGLALMWGPEAAEQPIAVRTPPATGVVVVESRSHGDRAAIDRFLDGRPVGGRRAVGSSLKFCEIARGAADLYPRFGPTHEWDTAAGQAVLAAAGGRTVTENGAPLGYGKANFLNPPWFLASGAG